MVQRVLLLLPVLACAVQVQVQPAHVDYTGLRSTMLGLAAGKIDQGTIAAVTGFMKTIKEDLLEALEADRNHTQTIFNDAVDDVDQCNRDRDAWFLEGGSLSSWNTNVTDLHTLFDDCRSQENTTFETVTTDCNVVTTRVCNWRTCELPAGGFENGDDEEVDAYMECIIGFCEENRGGYYTERETCINVTTIHHTQVDTCDEEQGDFEDKYCDREAQVQFKCKEYDTSRFNTETTYYSVKTETQDLEEIFQAQFVALHHLICYGNQILNNSTDLTGCDSVGDNCEQDFTDCPTISYGTPLPFTPCEEPKDNYPCTTAYHADFYAQYDDSHTPVADCHECTDADVQVNAWGGERITTPTGATIGLLGGDRLRVAQLEVASDS